MDTSMDGGAPVGDTFDEATTEEPTTEEVVPVEVTFTLMSEDGSAVAFEGTVPEGLTLVSGDGTNHIEFTYNENPAVTVCLDGGADNNVLVANEYDVIQLTPQYLEILLEREKLKQLIQQKRKNGCRSCTTNMESSVLQEKSCNTFFCSMVE